MNPSCRRCGHAPLLGVRALRPLQRQRAADRQQYECLDPQACEDRALLAEHHMLDRQYRSATALESL